MSEENLRNREAIRKDKIVLLRRSKLVNILVQQNVMFGVLFSTQEQSIVSLPDKTHLYRYRQELSASINFLQVYLSPYGDGD